VMVRTSPATRRCKFSRPSTRDPKSVPGFQAIGVRVQGKVSMTRTTSSSRYPPVPRAARSVRAQSNPGTSPARSERLALIRRGRRDTRRYRSGRHALRGHAGSDASHNHVGARCVIPSHAHIEHKELCGGRGRPLRCHIRYGVVARPGARAHIIQVSGQTPVFETMWRCTWRRPASRLRVVEKRSLPDAILSRDGTPLHPVGDSACLTLTYQSPALLKCFELRSNITIVISDIVASPNSLESRGGEGRDAIHRLSKLQGRQPCGCSFLRRMWG
jgi:hypothetical protein